MNQHSKPSPKAQLAAPKMSGWIARVWPSSIVREDPLQHLLVDGRYSPIPLAGWKLTPSIERHLLSLRRSAHIEFRSDAKLGVIVPVRDREHQILRLIPRLSEKLTQQNIDYRILVVEQSAGNLFNKGALINAGFRTLADRCDYVCIHDVDAIPVKADYRCPSAPLRLVTHLIDSRHGARREPRYFGGAISVRCDHFSACNGFSNEYWGWGKEDDDFLFRLLFSGRVCFSDQDGTFEDLPNPLDQQITFTKLTKPRTLRANRRRRSLLMRGLVDYRREGLSSLRYSQSGELPHDGYSRVLVNI
jgi:hypothetical protein